MKQDVRIAVSDRSFVVRNNDTTDDQILTGSQLVNVITVSNAKTHDDVS